MQYFDKNETYNQAGLLHFINPQKLGKILRGGTPLADLFLQVRINGDVALLKAIMFVLLEKENAVRKDYGEAAVFDWDFIKTKTVGIEVFLNDLKKADFQALVGASGVSEDQIRQAAELIVQRKKLIICWAMGLTQHKNAVGNVQEIVNLLLLRGAIGKEGAGTCPVRGHSNVQGDRTMGIWEAPKKEFLDNLQKTFGFEPPREHGYNTVAAIQAMHEEKAKVFFAMGGNFLSATPDTEYTAAALRKCDLTVHVSTKLNRSHLVHGKTAIILPCLGRMDIDKQESGAQFVTCENSMGVVQMSQGILEPCSKELKSEVAIVCGLAQAAMGNKSTVKWSELVKNYDKMTIYGLDDRYRGIFNERRIILMNEKDMLTEGVHKNDVVDLFGEYNGVTREARRFLVVPYDIPKGNVATYFPEANTLIPIDSYADKSHTPTSKSVVITIKKSL